MKLLLIAVIFSMLSGCGMYPQGSSGNDAGQQSQTPMTGNGGGGGY